MASGTVSGTYRGFTLRSVWSSTSNTAGNYSDITVNHYLDCASGWALYITGRTNSCTCGEYKEFSSPSISTGGGSTIHLGTTYHRVYHDNDGRKTVNLSTSFNIQATISGVYLNSITNSGDITLDNIPRYTSITSFSVSKRNETSVSVSYTTSDSIDWVWYSKDNGANWSNLPNNNIITGLSPNTTYNFKIRVRRTDSQLTTDSSTVSQTTYKAPSQSLKSKTETSITMNWSCDSTANHIWYSKDNGSNWVDVGDVSGTSGSYTITGLSANTSYNIKTRVRRSATNTTYDSSASSQTTYDYPYCTSSPNFTIGSSLKLDFYNPLGRSINIVGIGADGSQIFSGSTTGTTASGFNDSTSVNSQYASIPNSQSGTYKVQVTYGSITKTRNNGNTYSVVGTEIPTFNNFTYKDSNTIVSGVTGDDQVMVKGLSTVQVNISSANKMVAQNSATPNNYAMNISNLSDIVEYSSGAISTELGTINDSGTQRLNVIAYDSRGLSKTVYKDITVYDYSKPVINTTITRLNNFEAETTIKVNGTYTKLAINNINKNDITRVQYRYREVGGTWSSWVNIATTTNNGTFTCSDVILSLDYTKSFEFEIRAIDTLQQTTVSQATVNVGQAIFFISTNNRTCYINGKEVVTNDYTGDVDITGDVDVTGSMKLNNKNVVTENYTGDVNVNGLIKINDQEILTYDVVDTW